MADILTAAAARELTAQSEIRRDEMRYLVTTEIIRACSDGRRHCFCVFANSADWDYLAGELVLAGYHVESMDKKISWL